MCVLDNIYNDYFMVIINRNSSIIKILYWQKYITDCNKFKKKIMYDTHIETSIHLIYCDHVTKSNLCGK